MNIDNSIKPYSISRNSGKAYWLVDILWVMLATGEDTGGEYCLMEQLCPKDSGPPPHLHEREAESLYIIEGEAKFLVSGNPIQAEAGSFIAIPRNTPHSFVVESETVRLLNFYVPAGFEQTIIELGVPAETRTLPPPSLPKPDPQKIQEIQQKYGMRNVEA